MQTASLTSRVVLLFLAALRLSASEAFPRVAQTLSTTPEGGQAAVVVARADSGQVVFARAADRPQMMASLTKLYTAAASLLELGPQYEFHTRLQALGPVSGTALPGLGIIASGSPALDEHHSNGQPNEIFAAWARHLQSQGINRIDGDLVIDNSLFSGPIRPDSYPPGERNAQAWWSAPASAFAWNDNCIEVRVVPTTPGQQARVEVRPRSDLIRIVNRTNTVASGGGKLIVRREIDANTVIASGRYDATTSWYPMSIHAQPDLLAGHHLAAIFADNGVPISGSVRLGPVPSDASATLLTHSDPIGSCLAILNQRSQNFYGEQLFRVLGHRIHGAGSITNGRRAVPAILTQGLAIPLTDTTILDGSGLSYGNRASGRDIIALLSAMHQHPRLSAPFADSLKDKWRRAIKGRVKTGSLAPARCLAGYLDGADGHRYAFAILLERGDSGSIGWATRLRDLLFNAIADDLNPP